ncbi:hypothetical protein COUCH_36540 [Couchioplanes caeruleus]|uniref:hypothetical protein n=1 Tax=Couchioplanes caeruleus TaxID=56438 RepID=UPI0020BE5D55|nr:hypothetical protein [Couchioplanes caeruleus]UQU64405.1 hypothetical protein COUCH_36540 [Couchioplanes caeruleus]
MAGAPALLVAKAHKIGERVAAGRGSRIKPKDAGDVFRLMRGRLSPQMVGMRLAELKCQPICSAGVEAAMRYFDELFGAPRARGVELAVDNLASAAPEDEVRAVMPAYVRAMLAAYRGAGAEV